MCEYVSDDIYYYSNHYKKGIEKLSGEAFNGTLLFTWLIKVQDKALQFAWIPILEPLKENYLHRILLRYH